MIDTDAIREQLSAQPSDRAVSPVIGVILMVAITVILAAVIGTFVLDLGQSVGDTGPTASLSFADHSDDYTPGDSTAEGFIEINHQSGDSLEADKFKIIVRNTSSNAEISTWDAGTINNGTNVNDTWYQLNNNNMTQSDTVSVGDVVTLQVLDDSNADTAGDGNDYSVTVVSTDTDNRIAAGTVEVN